MDFLTCVHLHRRIHSAVDFTSDGSPSTWPGVTLASHSIQYTLVIDSRGCTLTPALIVSTSGHYLIHAHIYTLDLKTVLCTRLYLKDDKKSDILMISAGALYMSAG